MVQLDQLVSSLIGLIRVGSFASYPALAIQLVFSILGESCQRVGNLGDASSPVRYKEELSAPISRKVDRKCH